RWTEHLEGGPVGGAAPARRRPGARRRGPIVGGAVVLAVARADRPRPGNAARQRIEGVARLRETEARRGGDARAGPAGRAGQRDGAARCQHARARGDRKSTRLNSSHLGTSYAVFCWYK